MSRATDVDRRAPIAVQYTPDSVLSKPTAIGHSAFFVDARPRLATCGGVAWFHGLHLATLNLLGNAVHTYRFDSFSQAFAPVQILGNMNGLVLPENLAFSPGGDLLAITNSIDGAVNLYGVDRRTHAIDATPVTSIKSGGNPHGVSFSPCSTVLAYSTVENPGGLWCFKILGRIGGRLEVALLQHISNRFAPLKPKGVAFSPDGRFLAICYGRNAEMHPTVREAGFVAIHRFDGQAGCGLDPVCIGGTGLGLVCAEDVNFFPDGSLIVVTDQATDSAVIVSFDRTTGTIGETQITLGNPEAQLSFPHGNAVSSDGRYLAIANYGEDKATVYAV
jgi:DNA-binding beta-propeller fold protein YncE